MIEPHQIFISHSVENADFAHRLARELQLRGMNVWIAPESIFPGEEWVDAISRGLESSNVFILVMTPQAVNSNWVKSEANMAIALQHSGKMLFIPLDVIACDPPVIWKGYHFISFQRGFENGLNELLARLAVSKISTTNSIIFDNPFSQFLSSGTFLTIGRDNILQEIAQVITLPSPDDRDLQGLPGMGKTSLLRYISGPEFIHAYEKSFFWPYDKQSHLLFICYISGWIESVHPFLILYREFSKAYREFHSRLMIEHPDIRLPDVLVRNIDDKDVNEALSILESHLRRLVQAGIRIVILFDDFDTRWAYECLNADESARLSSWKEYCSLIIATEKRLEEVNPASKGSPLYKRLTQIPVREILEDEARTFLGKTLEIYKATLPEKDIAELINLVGGFPYLLLLAGRALWDLRRRTGLDKTPDKPLPSAMKPYLHDRLTSELQRMFEQYYTNRNPEERTVLLNLAKQDSLIIKDEMDGQQYIRLLGLEQYGLVNINSEGEVNLFSSLFHKFLADQEDMPNAEAVKIETQLTELQRNLYKLFRSRPDEVLTFEELGSKVWNWPSDPWYQPTEEEKRKMHIAVSKLRRALENSATGERIVNLRSRGYRYESAQRP